MKETTVFRISVLTKLLWWHERILLKLIRCLYFLHRFGCMYPRSQLFICRIKNRKPDQQKESRVKIKKTQQNPLAVEKTDAFYVSTFSYPFNQAAQTRTKEGGRPSVERAQTNDEAGSIIGVVSRQTFNLFPLE